MNALTCACRQLRSSPAFALAAIGSLALGIGANTAIFSLANVLLFRPVAVREPSSLVRIATVGVDGRPGGVLGPAVDLIREERLFDHVCGLLAPGATVDINGHVAPVNTHTFSGDCFATLGVRAALGRLLTADDDRPGAANVVVLSYDAWRQHFGGSPLVLGTTINIEGATFTVVGVTESSFTGLQIGFPTQLFWAFSDRVNLGAGIPRRSLLPMEVFARLKPGGAVEAATARLQALWPQVREASVPPQYVGVQRARYLQRRILVASGSTGLDYVLRPRFQTPLVVLLAVCGVVLLVMSVNVASLLLARAARRRREVLVRCALGASRWRLIQDSLAESGLLLAGGFIGAMMLSYWVDKVLVSLYSGTMVGLTIDVAPDGRVLAFTVVLSAIAFVVFAVAPAFKVSGVDGAALNAASTRLIGDRRGLGKAAIVAQATLTIVLVSLGSLFVGLLKELRATPLGVAVDHGIGLQLAAVPGGYQSGFSGSTYYRALLEGVASLPGVQSSALSHPFPLGGALSAVRTGVVGSDREIDVEQVLVTDSIFATMQIPFVLGASFDRGDDPNGARTGVVSESVARALFGSASPIGRSIHVGVNPLNQAVRIVGVVRDARIKGVRQENPSVVYLNYWQSDNAAQGYPSLVVRTDGDPAQLALALEAVVRKAGREYPVGIRTLTDMVDMSLTAERLLALLSTAFALLGLTIAAIGVYGLLSFSVAQRTGEIGIRMALGANRQQIVWLVLQDMLTLVAIGIVVGAPAAWAAQKTAGRLVYGVGSFGIASIGIAVALLFVVAGAAVWFPVRRAAAVDPMQALRRE